MKILRSLLRLPSVHPVADFAVKLRDLNVEVDAYISADYSDEAHYGGAHAVAFELISGQIK